MKPENHEFGAPRWPPQNFRSLSYIINWREGSEKSVTKNMADLGKKYFTFDVVKNKQSERKTMKNKKNSLQNKIF